MATAPAIGRPMSHERSVGGSYGGMLAVNEVAASRPHRGDKERDRAPPSPRARRAVAQPCFRGTSAATAARCDGERHEIGRDPREAAVPAAATEHQDDELAPSRSGATVAAWGRCLVVCSGCHQFCPS